MGDYVGRKLGIICSCLVFCIGVALQIGALHLPLFIVGRVIAGLGVGLISCLIPMYQSEWYVRLQTSHDAQAQAYKPFVPSSAPKWIRGAVVACYQWAITIGLLLASIVNNSTQNRMSHSAWRIPIGIQFAWAAILAGGMCLLPESPRWLIKRGREEKAAKNLARLIGANAADPEVGVELNEIRANLRAEEDLGSSTYLDCFRLTHNKILFRVMTGIWLQACVHLSSRLFYRFFFSDIGLMV